VNTSPFIVLDPENAEVFTNANVPELEGKLIA
jgi:hypothetical protein